MVVLDFWIFLDFCPAGLEYCSAVWCSAVESDLKILDSVVRSARLLTGDVAQRRSVGVLCMLFNHVMYNQPNASSER